MLELLRRIVQEVNSAKDILAALDLMVCRVREAMDTQAATIYLIDNRHAEYVLMATEGLNPDAVGKIRFGLDKGLVGLVGRREEPISLENGQEHPCFYPEPSAKEEDYVAFLGVPIIHHRRLYGVLTVQQEEARRYDPSEEAFLITICAQLAGVIAHAEATGELQRLPSFHELQTSELDEAALGGIPCVPGVGIGTAMVVYPLADLDSVPERESEDIEQELVDIKQALQSAREDINRLKENTKHTLPEEEHSLFDVYLRILDENALGKEVIECIREGYWAQTALKKVIKSHIHQFSSMEDPYLRERASDFKDLGRRVLAHLQANGPEDLDYPEDTILVGEDITASRLAEVPEGRLKGIISGKGSSNSHVSILARALGIPTIMGAKGRSLTQLGGDRLIVDGYFGQVYVSPSEKLLEEFTLLANEEQELEASLESLRHEDARTPDGYAIKLYVNMGLAGDTGLSMSIGSDGVGLFRTEISFMKRDRFPTEDEQIVIYRQLLKAFSPRPVTMRTLDVGGDKALPYFPVEEDNPFLGWRGIRITLDHPDVFLVQVRAMLKANVETGNLKIMLPMISGVGELDEALNLIQQAFREVKEEGFDIEMPPIGVMIEVPSAVYQTRDLARRVDFISVGSNDLTQYLLAVDRNNPRVSGLYDSLHPAVLSALLQIVESAHSLSKPVSICGEMASDPVAVILLLAMGFDSLSMNSRSLLRMKWVIRNFTLAYARKLLADVLNMDNPTLIRFHLEKALEEVGLGGLIRAGKQ